MANKTGTPGNDTLTGTANADSLFGLGGNDSLLGLGGNDTLDGGLGIDTLVGGAGNDTYIVDRTTDSIIETAGSGKDTVLSSVTYTLGDNLDNLTLTGTGAINGTGNSLNNTITGNAGNNTIFGGDGQDTLYGGDGNDTLFGDTNDDEIGGSIDILNGGNGNDSLDGESGDDILFGGDGNDTLSAGYEGFFGGNHDILFGGDGNDFLSATNTSYFRSGGDYRGTEDTLRGGNGNDTLIGGVNNVLDGGSGDDTYFTSGRGDTILDSAGIDTVQSFRNYALDDYNGIENLTLTGTSSINGTGNTLDNIIIGNAGNNFIQAGSFGVVGERDTLTGGAGRDTFLLGNATQVFYDDRNKATAGTGDYALITDFNAAQDAIKLNGNRNNYRLATSPAGLPGGTAIYLNKPGSEPDELIAIVQGSSGLNLFDNYFRFTTEEINLSTLNGRNGFVIKGIDVNDRLGYSVSDAGDVNGDGFNDLIIGAPGPNFGSSARESYVVFGKATGFNPNLDVSTLNGINGFKISGDQFGSLGFSVSGAGDVNGDSFSDIIIGTRDRNESYVVFGKATGFSPNFDVSTLNGTNGFKISGDQFSSLGFSVSGAGDVNGDGFSDIIISASDPTENYVVFGKATGFSPNLDVSTLDGTNGFQINNNDYGNLGYSVSKAGDVNGDGFDDLVIGNPVGGDYAGIRRQQTYVVFGKATGFSPSFSLSNLNGTNGFAINISTEDFVRAGTSVSDAGDINGDGFDDLVIGGASQFYFYDGTNILGPNRGYVVFGKAEGFDATIDVSTLNGSNGFVIEDFNEIGSIAGFKVSSAGDVNSDGFDDIIVGFSSNDVNTQTDAGISYVVFGKATGFDASINVLDINGRNGFVINGIDAGDYSGRSVSSAGDVNGDGFDDLTVGAPDADSNYQNSAGESYVIFGRDFTNSVTNAGTAGNDTLTGTAGDDILIGGLGNDRLIGGLGSDVLYGGAGNDTLTFGAVDRRLNGGSGVDTLRIDGADNIDLTTISNNKFTAFEIIDITGTGNNSLAFTRLDVLDLSDTINRLIVNGNSGDRVTSTGQGWVFGGTTTVDSILYRQYTSGAATLLVDTDITQTIS